MGMTMDDIDAFHIDHAERWADSIDERLANSGVRAAVARYDLAQSRNHIRKLVALLRAKSEGSV
jgi:hypothetical protein